ncbi:hypothetical protein W822_20155 [Advenella kashmirensis W13003]|uniref:Uncharacterized protein n=1 Tax=Advenella kashmirensis W13003 TaxID=1424334 RepID=V8QPN0_9BURK|nr:hypothetical protein [Advenella kashmirensis]ETF00954.1 hypothetical protein W822_20155 [Advenella kashmirensis W13003]
MIPVQTIEQLVLSHIRHQLPRHELDTQIKDRKRLNHLLDDIGHDCGVVIYGPINTGEDIVRFIRERRR